MFVEWWHLLTVVKPETLIRDIERDFGLWWRWKPQAVVIGFQKIYSS